MSDERFKVHRLIEDYPVGEDIDFSFLRKLVSEKRKPDDLEIDILDNGKRITYRECVDLLNNLCSLVDEADDIIMSQCIPIHQKQWENHKRRLNYE